MKRREEGFSVLEVTIAIVIASIFIFSIIALAVLGSKIQKTNADFKAANDLAYQNLRTFVNAGTASKVNCASISSNAGGSGATTLGDSIKITMTTTRPSSIDTPTLKQYITISTPYGCSGVNELMPYRIESTVLYGEDDGTGNGRRNASYATFVSPI